MGEPVISTAEIRHDKQDSSREKGLALWLDRALVACLFLFAVSAPNSIAATQTAWALGLFVWMLRLMVRPRPRFVRTPLDYTLLAFVIVTMIGVVTSYAPDISSGKLPAVSLFTIFYLTAENVKTRRVLRLLVLTLVASCMVNVLFTFGQRAWGKGVKVERLSAASPLVAAKIQNGDTLLTVDGRSLRQPEELEAALNGPANSQPVIVHVYRFEWMFDAKLPRGALLAGSTPTERLGIESWSRGREWRAAGFYGLYVTYADVLQIIGSLALGLFVATRRKRSLRGLLLLIAVAGISGALLLTITRAAWLGFLISAFVIVLAGASRRAVLILFACALPVALAGFLLLHQKRNVGFLDERDQSTTWRETVWREGVMLLV